MQAFLIFVVVQLIDPVRLLLCIVAGANVRGWGSAVAWGVALSEACVLILFAINDRDPAPESFLAAAFSGPLICCLTYLIASRRRRSRAQPAA